MLAPKAPEMTYSDSQTTGFLDANVGASVGSEVSPLDYEVGDAQTSADLAKFLSRPVRIATLSWSQATAAGSAYGVQYPWQAFANHPSIKNKLQNYAFIRGNLKIKIITNGSPFLYGSMRVVWNPLVSTSGLGFKEDTASGSVSSGVLIPQSQKPGVWVTPAHSEGAEITLPFLWPRSFLRVGVNADFINMGRLLHVIYNPLQSANGTTSSVSVQFYAWMENVILAGPTLAAALQADEYGVGPVSAPASAMAAVSSKFEDVPYIGKFAKATTIGASAVSKMASLFGYTNVPVIEDTKPVRNSPFPQIASSQIGYVNEKLALDPKNELSIDPAIVGMDGVDELAISHFAARESYLTGVDWTSASVEDTPLFTSLVQPQLGVSSGTIRQFVPMGLLSTLFKNWRGDIIFRFKFIASPFHKGRVRLSYDPYSAVVQTTGDTGPYVFNRIIDLGAETDVEFRVPYQQALPWCYSTVLPDSAAWSTSTTPAVVNSDTFTNGVVSLKVLTPLTGPTSTSTVGIQVFVRGAENLEFSNPVTGNYDLSPFTVQSLEYSEKGEADTNELGGKSSDSSHRALVNFGESVRSLRTLLRRQNLLDTVYVPAPTASTVGVFRINQTRFPIHYGYDPNGWQTAKGVVATTTNFPFNFVQTTPWHLISNCFIAQRGSMIWTYNPSKQSLGLVSRVTRYNYAFPGMTNDYVSGVTTNANITECSIWKSGTATNAGSSLTHTSTTNGHSVLAPSYSAFKFQTTSPGAASSPGSTTSVQYDGSVYDSLVVEYPYDATSAPLTGVTIERYFGVGTDYTLHFFMNCPTLNYLVASSIVPV